MSNKTVPTITFSLPYDLTSQTQYYLTSSEISPNPYDSYLDCGLLEPPVGKNPIADAPPALDLNYGFPLFPNSNWSFQPIDSIGYSDFQGSLGSDSFSTSPNSSNPNSPSSSIHSELSDTSPRPALWDQSLYMARNPPSPYALTPIEAAFLNGHPAADLNKRKRSLDDVYQPMLQYFPDMGQGEHAINELFANGVVCLEPYEFQSDNSVSSEMFPFSMATNQTMTPMVNVFNTFVPPLPSPPVRSTSLLPNSCNAPIITAKNGTTSRTSTTSSKSSSPSTTTSKAGKKGRKLSNSPKSKSGITTIKKEVITPTTSSTGCGSNNCDSSCGMGSKGTTDKRSLQQLRDVITTIDPTMKGGLVDGLKYLAQLAKNGPNRDISRSDIPTEMLKISMANSVMGMLYPQPSANILPLNNSQSSVPTSSQKQSVELSQPTVVIGNNGQSYTITSTPCSYNGAYLNCTPSPFIKEEPLYEEPPTNKRKKARSNQTSTQASKVSQQSFRFNVINSVNPKQQPQRLPLQQQAPTSMVTVL